MRWPEKKRRKRFPRVVYSIELFAASLRTVGIVLGCLFFLFELKGWLESGHWSTIPVRSLLIESLHIPFFVELSGHYERIGAGISGADIIVKIFLEKFPLWLFFLTVGKVLSLYIFWFVDHVFPEKTTVSGPNVLRQTYVNFK